LPVGTYDGMAVVLSPGGTSLEVVSSQSVSAYPVDAIGKGRGGSIWIVSGFRAARARADGRVEWQSTDNGYTEPAGLLVDGGHGHGPRLWVSSMWRVDGFDAFDEGDDKDPD